MRVYEQQIPVAMPGVPLASVNKVYDAYHGLKEKLEGHLLEEREAIDATAISLLARGNHVLGGNAGSAKTRLLKGIVNSFTSESEHPIGMVVCQSDTAPIQITGGEIRKTLVDQTGRRTTEINEIEGAVKPDNILLQLDEYPRLSEEGQDALLSILEERVIRAPGHEDMPMPYLLGSIATQNFLGDRFRVGVPNASRFQAGAILGNESDAKQRAKGETHFDGWSSKFAQVQPFMAAEDMLAVQNTVLSNRRPNGTTAVTISDRAKRQGYEYARRIVEVEKDLTAYGEHEDTTRMTGQIGLRAVALALADGRESLIDNDVAKAAKAVATSRVLLLNRENARVNDYAQQAYKEIGVDGA